MSDSPTPTHALGQFVESVESDPSDTGLQLRIRPDRMHLNLRGNPSDGAFLKGAETALSQPLPINPNTVSVGAHGIYWLGPNEWHIVSSPGNTKLPDALQQHGVCNDVSGGYVLLELTGSAATDVLAKGCTLDFHPCVFGVGDCAQSNLAKTAILIAQPEAAGTYELIVRRSFAEYAALWLRQASRQQGLTVSVG